jgi:hypothetical protein
MTEVTEYSFEEAYKYQIANKTYGKQIWYLNIYGWDSYLTLEPTFATPSGNLKEYPRAVKLHHRTYKYLDKVIKSQYEIRPVE